MNKIYVKQGTPINPEIRQKTDCVWTGNSDQPNGDVLHDVWHFEVDWNRLFIKVY